MSEKLKDNIRALQLNVDSVVGFAGFTTTVATLLCLLREIPLVFSFDIGMLSPLVGLSIFGFALLTSCAGISRLAFQICSKNCMPLVIVAAFGAAASIVSLAPLCSSGILGGACLLIMGAGVAALACLWFVHLCVNESKITLFYTVVGILAGCVSCLAISFMESFISNIATASAFSVSCLFGLMAVEFDKSKYVCKIDNETSDKRMRINIASTIMLASTFFEFGFIVSFVEGEYITTICLVAAIGATLIISIDSISVKRIKERNLAPIMPALTVFAFMLLVIDPTRRLFLWGSLVIITLLLTTYMSLGTTAMTHHIRLSKLAPLRVFSWVRTIDYAVFVFGLLLGYGTHMTLGQFGMFIGIGIAFCYCFISFLSYKSRFPEAGFEEVENTEVVEQKSRKGWRQRCRVVGEENSLSERQMEILMIMAQGRDAKYIAKSLTVSLSTVQTHIRNIYRKVGVHSRQELIDLIEETKLYGED